MADVEQTQKMIPFITCEISLCHCELVFGVNVFDWDFMVQIDSIEQPIKSNSASSGNMSHCRASSLYNHLDHCFVVFKYIQRNFLTRRMGRLGKQNQQCLDHQSFREMSFAFEVYEVLHETGSCTGFTVLDYSDTCFREELRRSDPIIQVRGKPSNLNPASKEMISDSVELCENEVGFLHIQRDWNKRMASENAQCST